ncbi:MAG: hypothetical protein ACYS30_26235, partial [Planctomycetota bacterium]
MVSSKSGYSEAFEHFWQSCKSEFGSRGSKFKAWREWVGLGSDDSAGIRVELREIYQKQVASKQKIASRGL